MVHNKRKKFSRQRETHTHGWGAKKKHRGAGHRGGRGNAGLGKKGDARKTTIWTDTKHFGKSGFVPKSQRASKAINISELELALRKLTAKGHASEGKGAIDVNLTKAGYTKLLSTGTPTKKMNITVDSASEAAIGKISNAGGTLTTKPKKEKKAKKEQKKE